MRTALPGAWGFLPTLTSLMAAGVYDIPVVQTGFRVAVTNTTPIAAYRGAGRPEATAAIERAVDLFAAEIKRGIDWAIVGVAVQGRSVGLVNMGSAPLRAAATEWALAGGAAPGDAAALAAEGTAPPADNNASSGYRQHLARVLVRRALAQAAPPPGRATE